MKTLASYLFWKNVYHVRWLNFLAFMYFYPISKGLRAEVRLAIGIARVERRDEHRIYMIEFNRRMGAIKDIFKDITEQMIYIQSLVSQIEKP